MNRGFATLLLALLLTGCLSPSRPPLLIPWVYTDLRLLDEASPLKVDGLPGQDLIAVYTRAIGEELQVRLDFLDLNPQPVVDLYLALDNSPGGNPFIFQNYRTDIDWDTLVVIPAAAPIQVLNNEYGNRPGIAVRVLRDPVADMISISLDRSALPGSPFDQRLQIFLTRPGGATPVDSSVVIDSSSPAPQRAPVLLAFWNTLSAYTSAQAMRRWDGAHTGPLGGRHGLRNLLRAARSHQVPLALLDLKLPASLSALDYVEGKQMVRTMAEEGLLIVPEAAPIDLPGFPPLLVDQALAVSRETAISAQLPNSPFAYLPLDHHYVGSIAATYNFIFTRQTGQPAAVGAGPTHILRSGTQRVIPLPALSNTEADLTQSNDGPPLGLRRALVDFALQAAENPGTSLLVIGGDLQQSAWGDPQFARLAFDWIEAHPWVKPLGAQDLLAQRMAGKYSQFDREKQKKSPVRNTGQAEERIISLAEEISQAPASPLTEAARQAFFSLFSQASRDTADLDRLRAHYAGQIYPLLAAANWSENPSERQDCSQDLDQDGVAECVLASGDTLAVFDIPSASLTYLFARSPGSPGQANRGEFLSKEKSSIEYSVHELIGPSSQLIFGQGDPGQWDLAAGLGADPEVFPGAFYEPGISFALSQTSGQLIFANPDFGYTKTYSLLPAGIRIDFHSQAPLTVHVPLALDPWLRFCPDWGQLYAGQASPAGWTWGLVGGPFVLVSSNGEISTNSFSDNRNAMGSIEDPNANYPPGHYLPFPISFVQVQGQGAFFVEIQFQDPVQEPAGSPVP